MPAILKILCFTGSRAEYYILRPLLKKISNLENINLKLIVSGGITKEINKKTIKDIRNDKIEILSILDIPERHYHHSEKIGFLCLELSPIINKFNPNLCIVYADRFESFAFATTATHLDKVLLHIEAGDITEGGTYDDFIRHCITKMSHLFCTSTKSGLKILSRLGEDSWRSIQSGLLSYDDMQLITEEDKSLVINELKINDNLPIIIATMHSIPKDLEKTKNESINFFSALKKFSYKNDAHIFITGPNSDNGNQFIIENINLFLDEIRNALYFESLGGFRYQTLMSLSSVRSVIVCGNSSSIIKEAPFYKAHSLNIGSRQKGRESASTQIDCEANELEIIENLERLILFQNTSCINPYYVKNASDKVVDFILKIFENYSEEEILDKKWNRDKD
tara:strand:+ start:4973 stop:6154 length:1182 start_codon:yes stop_codon:yes gene_type:complete